jgi:hypothetical protein
MGSTYLQHCESSLCQLRPLLFKVVSIFEELVAVALVKQVPEATSLFLIFGWVLERCVVRECDFVCWRDGGSSKRCEGETGVRGGSVAEGWQEAVQSHNR